MPPKITVKRLIIVWFISTNLFNLLFVVEYYMLLFIKKVGQAGNWKEESSNCMKGENRSVTSVADPIIF